MRRKDRELSTDEGKNILKKCNHGTLCTVNEDSSPYGVIVNYVYYNDLIIFHCAKEGKKIENILNNDNVFFTVLDHEQIESDKFTTYYKSAFVKGKAYIENDEGKKKEYLIKLIELLTGKCDQTGLNYILNNINRTLVCVVKPIEITAKQNLNR